MMPEAPATKGRARNLSALAATHPFVLGSCTPLVCLQGYFQTVPRLSTFPDLPELLP